MKTASSVIKQFDQFILSGRDRLPIISYYGKTRGWPFVVAWAHRISGLLLVLYLILHIYTLSALAVPAEFDAKMDFFGFFLFILLEWMLSRISFRRKTSRRF
ncbi:hypothetical protein ACFL9U_17375 [Thermodesulfobacteriota bacterium]